MILNRAWKGLCHLLTQARTVVKHTDTYQLIILNIVASAGLTFLLSKPIASLDLVPVSERGTLSISTSILSLFVLLPLQALIEEIAFRLLPLQATSIIRKQLGTYRFYPWFERIVYGAGFGLAHLVNIMGGSLSAGLAYSAVMSVGGIIYVYAYQRWGLAGSWYMHTFYNGSLAIGTVIAGRMP